MSGGIGGQQGLGGVKGIKGPVGGIGAPGGVGCHRHWGGRGCGVSGGIGV